MSGADAAAGGEHPIPRHAGWLKAVVVLATLMQVLDMTIANVALPHMRSALGANQDTISWVLTSYILASAVVIPMSGWLSDRIGRRRLYLLSVAGFVAASVLCGLAINIHEMVLFRILQGLSGAFLSPLAQAVMLDSTPREKHARAMALFGMGIVLGPVLGPVLGGWLTEHFNWRWVFFVNVPLGLVALTGLWFLLPDVRHPPRRFDRTGFLLVALALASFQLMLDRGEHVDWFSSPEIWIEMFVSISALWMFVVHSMGVREPLWRKDLLRDRNLLVGVALMAVMGFVLTGPMALMPIMLQGIFGYSVMDTGLVLATRGIGVIFMMSVAARLVERISVRAMIATGWAIIAATFWEMTQWNLDITWEMMALNGFVQGLGTGLVFVTISTVPFTTLPARHRTDAAGLVNLSRSMGSSISVSLVITLLSRNAAVSNADLTTNLTPYALGVDPRMFTLPDNLAESGLAMLQAEVSRQASMISFLDDFTFMMWITICAIPLTLLVKAAQKNDKDERVFVLE